MYATIHQKQPPESFFNSEKTIESRWYKNRYAPWGNIAKGDIVYFKNSGEPVTLRATVADVLQFSNLNPTKVKKILTEYGERDGITKAETEKYYEMFKDKKYCLLIFLKNPEQVEPFMVDKTGFGAMAAWIITEDIRTLKGQS